MSRKLKSSRRVSEKSVRNTFKKQRIGEWGPYFNNKAPVTYFVLDEARYNFFIRDLPPEGEISFHTVMGRTWDAIWSMLWKACIGYNKKGGVYASYEPSNNGRDRTGIKVTDREKKFIEYCFFHSKEENPQITISRIAKFVYRSEQEVDLWLRRRIRKKLRRGMKVPAACRPYVELRRSSGELEKDQKDLAKQIFPGHGKKGIYQR